VLSAQKVPVLPAPALPKRNQKVKETARPDRVGFAPGTIRRGTTGELEELMVLPSFSQLS